VIVQSSNNRLLGTVGSRVEELVVVSRVSLNSSSYPWTETEFEPKKSAQTFLIAT
jgi:hypothetical protein